jgi:hypothetical protein
MVNPTFGLASGQQQNAGENGGHHLADASIDSGYE